MRDRTAAYRRQTHAEAKAKASQKRILGEPMTAFQVADRLRYPPSMMPGIREIPFMNKLVGFAEKLGLLVFHVVNSKESHKGFPDLIIVGWGGIVFAELKTDAGTLEPDQEVWQFALNRIATLSFGLIQVVVWRPSDFGLDGPICKTLERLARPWKTRVGNATR